MPTQETRDTGRRPNTDAIRAEMKQLIAHLRRDVERTDEPRAQALFETSAEVIQGLVQTFDDYDAAEEPAFRRSGASPSTRA